jgi:hypothetical protein
MPYELHTPGPPGRPRWSNALWTAAALLSTLLPTVAWSQSSSDPPASHAGNSTWRISGFGTLGLTHTDTRQPWLFARDISQTGASSITSLSPDSRLGLQVNWQPSAQWEAVVQAVLRDRTKSARLGESLELGFLAYRPAPAWSIKIGRIKPDFFLLADVRNVGYAMPWVRPNVEFYGWIPGASLDGANVSYQWQADGADWAAKMWAGELGNTLSGLRTDGVLKWRGHNTYGFTLTREAGGLSLKASYLQSRTDLGTIPGVTLLEQTLAGLTQLPLPDIAATAKALSGGLLPDGRSRYIGLGAEYDSGPWFAYAEISRVTLEHGLAGGTHGYISVGRRWGRLTVYTIGGASNPEHAVPHVTGDWAAQLTPFLGSANAQALAAAAANAVLVAADARFDQKSLAVGLRWEVHDRIAVKLQLDHIAVDAYGAAQWRHSTTVPGKANVLSFVTDWVF